MSTPNEPENNSIKSALTGILKSRLNNLGDAAKQSLNDVGSNVTASVRTGFGLLQDQNTSFVTTNADPISPIYEVTASNEGKNAKVSLWPDRLEWEKGRGISGGKILLGLATGGASLLATGLRGQKDEFEALPLTAITSVSLRTDGLAHQLVTVATAGGAIDFRVSRYNAADFRMQILNQMQALSNAPKEVIVTALPGNDGTKTGLTSDMADQLERLAALKAGGILTEEEFQAKKTQILNQI